MPAVGSVGGSLKARLPWYVAYVGVVTVLAVLRRALSLGEPLGPDPALWGLSASSLLAGGRVSVPPGWPAVLAVASAVTGQPPWALGGALSLLVAAAVPVVVVALARRLDAPWPAAVAAGVAAAVAPDLVQFAFQIQPDALATLLALVVLAAGLTFEDRPDARTAAGFVGAAAALALVREHGVVVFAAAGLAVLAKWRPRAALAVAGAGVVAVLLLAALGTGWLPERVAQPLRESPFAAGHGAPPDYAKELPGPQGARFRDAWRDGDRWAVWLAVMGRLVARSGENLLAIALGAVAWAVVRKRPYAAYAVLSPVLPLVLVWSQRRHTSVLLPVALVGLAAVSRDRGRWLGGAGIVVVLLLGLVRLPTTLRDLGQAADATRDDERIAAWMAGQPGRWFLGGQHNEVNLFLRWSRNNPELPPPGTPMPTTWDGAAWRTMWVAPRGAMPPPFTEVHVERGLAVFRLEPPEGRPRPCEDVVPVDGPLFASGPVAGVAAPACEGEAGFRARPAPGTGWNAHPWVPAEGP